MARNAELLRKVARTLKAVPLANPDLIAVSNHPDYEVVDSFTARSKSRRHYMGIDIAARRALGLKPDEWEAVMDSDFEYTPTLLNRLAKGEPLHTLV